GVRDVERHRAAAERGHLLHERAAGHAAGFVIGEPDAIHEHVQFAPVAAMLGETFEDRRRVEVDEDPADVEDDGTNHGGTLTRPSRWISLPSTARPPCRRKATR